MAMCYCLVKGLWPRISIADINAIDILGQSPLHEALAHGHDTSVQVLLEKGADINAIDILGQSPFTRQ